MLRSSLETRLVASTRPWAETQPKQTRKKPGSMAWQLSPGGKITLHSPQMRVQSSRSASHVGAASHRLLGW